MRPFRLHKWGTSMKDKVSEFKKRRMMRLLKRMDAVENEGRWVTTENDNRIHLNKNGVPDKGNPYVIAAMTGKKPKLSTRYHEKVIKKIHSNGWKANANELKPELDSLPEGTVIHAYGYDYKKQGESFVDQKTGDTYDVGTLADWIKWDVPEDEDISLTREKKEETGQGESAEMEDPDVTSVSSAGKSEFSTQSLKDKIESIKGNSKGEEGKYFTSSGPEAAKLSQFLDKAPIGSKFVSEIDGWEYEKTGENTWKEKDVGENNSKFVANCMLNYGVQDFEPGNQSVMGRDKEPILTASESNVIPDITKTLKELKNKSTPPLAGEFVSAIESLPIGSIVEVDGDKFEKTGVDEYVHDGKKINATTMGVTIKYSYDFSIKEGSSSGADVLGEKKNQLQAMKNEYHPLADYKSKLGELPSGSVIEANGYQFEKVGDSFYDMSDGHEVSLSKVAVKIKHHDFDIKNKEDVDQSSISSKSTADKIQDLIEQGPSASVSEIENELNEFPENTIITIAGKKYKKIGTEDWEDPKTGEYIGDSWDIGYVLKHDNPSKTFEVSMGGEFENSSDTISSVNNWIGEYKQSFYNGTPEPDKKQLGDMLEQLDNGDKIKVGKDTYTKSVDKYGDTIWVSKKKGSITSKKVSNELMNGILIDQDVSVEKGNGLVDVPIDPERDTSKKYHEKDPDVLNSVTSKAIGFAGSAKVVHGVESFTREKKNNAVWDKSGGSVIDSVLRPMTGNVWKKLGPQTKKALWEYTDGQYDNMNELMREGASPYWDPEKVKKIQGKVDKATKAIDKCEAPQDVWLQRGISYHTLGKLFGISDDDFDDVKSKGAKAIYDLMTTSADYGQDKAFMSCGSSKGHGFAHKEVILNIFCPKGTKMIYAEPFSDYGYSHEYDKWDGESGQSYFSGEDETILQRGTMLVPRKVSMKGGQIFVDMDVIGQDY